MKSRLTRSLSCTLGVGALVLAAVPAVAGGPPGASPMPPRQPSQRVQCSLGFFRELLRGRVYLRLRGPAARRSARRDQCPQARNENRHVLVDGAPEDGRVDAEVAVGENVPQADDV